MSKIDYRRLSDKITEEIAGALNYWDHRQKLDLSTCTAADVLKMHQGGIERYQHEPIFRAKVMSLTASITRVVQDAERAATTSPIERTERE